MKFERNLVEHVGDEDNFYTVIDRARTLITDNQWWIKDEGNSKEITEIVEEEQVQES